MPKSYHNTNGLKGESLTNSEQKAQSQEEIILELFKSKNTPLSASQVFKEYPSIIPITSVRRAISNLKKSNVLEKTKETRSGLYGNTPEHLYKLTLNTPSNQRTMVA